jgi:hypothetical protein
VSTVSEFTLAPAGWIRFGHHKLEHHLSYCDALSLETPAALTRRRAWCILLAPESPDSGASTQQPSSCATRQGTTFASGIVTVQCMLPQCLPLVYRVRMSQSTHRDHDNVLTADADDLADATHECTDHRTRASDIEGGDDGSNTVRNMAGSSSYSGVRWLHDCIDLAGRSGEFRRQSALQTRCSRCPPHQLPPITQCQTCCWGLVIALCRDSSPGPCCARSVVVLLQCVVVAAGAQYAQAALYAMHATPHHMKVHVHAAISGSSARHPNARAPRGARARGCGITIPRSRFRIISAPPR